MIVSEKQAIEILKEGGIIIYPTDTAYGVGCRIDKEESVKRLFSLRRRPLNMATPVLFSSVEQVRKYVVSIPEDVEENLVKKFWPGALTIILSAKIEKIPELVRGGGKTVGVRIPDHEVALTLITGVGIPLIGTSANFHGVQTPYAIEDLSPEFISLTDGVVAGICSKKKESTVIDCSVTPWEVRRQGAIIIKRNETL